MEGKNNSRYTGTKRKILPTINEESSAVGLKYGHNGHTDINGHSSIIYYHYCVRISAIDTA